MVAVNHYIVDNMDKHKAIVHITHKPGGGEKPKTKINDVGIVELSTTVATIVRLNANDSYYHIHT